MLTIAESLNQSPYNAVLKAGVETISLEQTITFTKYVRVVLPLDGFVFWVNAALVSNSALPNVPQFDAVTPGQPSLASAPVTVTVKGSFHFALDRRQEEDKTIDVTRCIFTAESQIDDFTQINPDVMYLGTFSDARLTDTPIRFSFSHTKNFYQQAGLWHYVGDAIYPDVETQIVDTLNGFDQYNVVVSNSLPIWLALNQMTPPFPYPARQQVPMYPSFLVPDNAQPPYAAVHVYPEETQAISGAPIIGQTNTHQQATKDRVKITFYGLRNFNALDFVDYVNFMSEQDTAAFGVMNQPTMRDEKRMQSEMNVIAMKKSIVYEINYYQERVRDIARQLILHVIPNYYVGA